MEYTKSFLKMGVRMDFGERLQVLMSEKGMNQRQLVEKCNSTPPDDVVISASMISDILTGTSNKKAAGKQRGVDYQKVIKLAKALDCTVEYLVGVSDARLSASDDINNAAQTTGLSVECIEQLQRIKRGTRKTENYVAETIEYLIDHAYNCMMSDIVTMCTTIEKDEIKEVVEKSITKENHEMPIIYNTAEIDDVERVIASGKYKVPSNEDNIMYLLHYVCCVPIETPRKHNDTPPDYMHRYYQTKLFGEVGRIIGEKVAPIEYAAFLKEIGVTKGKGAAGGKRKKEK